jgi:hypothetical protein
MRPFKLREDSESPAEDRRHATPCASRASRDIREDREQSVKVLLVDDHEISIPGENNAQTKGVQSWYVT